jgi:uncharacterized protein DUF2784
MNLYVVMADAVALAHAAYAVFVVAGFVLIVAGIIMRWRWVRDFRFRLVHLAAIVLVCAESLIGVECPLTSLENRLRTVGGATGYPRDFIGYWIDRLVFYDFPPSYFALAYLSFAILVAATFVVAPPNFSVGRKVKAERIKGSAL